MSKQQAQHEQTDKPASTSYFLLVINDSSDAGPELYRCDNMESFTQALVEHVYSSKDELHAFAFRGERIPISMPVPVGYIEVDGVRTQIGSDRMHFDETGRITPSVRNE